MTQQINVKETKQVVKKKKYYRVGEQILIKHSKQKATVRELDIPNKQAIIEVYENGIPKIERLHFWEITKTKQPQRTQLKPLKGLDHTYNEVRKFHKTFNQPAENYPIMLTEERAFARATWMREEVQEFLDAPTVIDQADAMIDTIYFCMGTLVEMGVKPQRLFEIVQEANMSKIWEDGKVHYNELGKVMKPSSWQPPEPKLKEEIERQLAARNRG